MTLDSVSQLTTDNSSPQDPPTLSNYLSSAENYQKIHYKIHISHFQLDSQCRIPHIYFFSKISFSHPTKTISEILKYPRTSNLSMVFSNQRVLPRVLLNCENRRHFKSIPLKSFYQNYNYQHLYPAIPLRKKQEPLHLLKANSSTCTQRLGSLICSPS